MEIFSVFCILVIVLSFLTVKSYKRKFINILSFYIFVYMSIEVGYFYKFTRPERYVRYSYFLEVIVVLMAIFLFLVNLHRLEKKMLYISCFAIASVGIGLINLAVNPLQKKIVTGDMLIDSYWVGQAGLQYPSINSSVIKSLGQYVIFIFLAIIIYMSFSKDDYKLLLNKVCNWCKISIILGWIEFIFKNLFLSNTLMTIINNVFGYNKNVFISLEQRGSFYRLSGLTTEASHFSYVLFLTCIFFMANSYWNKQSKLWLYSAVVLLVLCMAFSSVLFLLALFLIYLVYINRSKIKLSGRFFSILASVILIFGSIVYLSRFEFFQNSYFGSRILDVLHDNALFTDLNHIRSLAYSSSRVRIVSILTNLSLVKDRLLFGIGIGATSSHGSMASIIAGLGIMGVFSWLLLMFGGQIKSKFKIYNSAYLAMIIIWAFTGLFVSQFWGMLYNTENFILVLSFLVLSQQEEGDCTE